MRAVRVVLPFRDLAEGVIRSAGETFEVDDERAAQLARNLPAGYVEIAEAAPTKAKPRAKRASAARTSAKATKE